MVEKNHKTMAMFQSYGFIISISVIIIISYLFNVIAKRTSIPSVLMLIALGIILKSVMSAYGINEGIDLFSILEILGIIGLIMIVLEAALDLKLTKDKKGIILKSFAIATSSLIVTSVLIAYVIQAYIECDFYVAMVYSLPLSIMSSAIIIPSVSNLPEEKKEFMIYESTFSDILGIMYFYFLIQNSEASGAASVGLNIVITIVATVVLAIVASYGLVFLFQNIKTDIKLFLLIAVLMLLYSIGKTLHLSSLVLILVFGLTLANKHIFFRGKLAWHLKKDAIEKMYKDFHIVTLESSFVVRTFFFVIFGTTISLATILDLKVIYVSIAILAILFGTRWISLRIFFKGDIHPMLSLAPRGLITILLFYSIPKEFEVQEFNTGVLLMVIIVSSLIMAVGLMSYKKKSTKEIIEIETEETHKNTI